jgi:hypothetical protein
MNHLIRPWIWPEIERFGVSKYWNVVLGHPLVQMQHLQGRFRVWPRRCDDRWISIEPFRTHPVTVRSCWVVAVGYHIKIELQPIWRGDVLSWNVHKSSKHFCSLRVEPFFIVPCFWKFTLIRHALRWPLNPHRVRHCGLDCILNVLWSDIIAEDQEFSLEQQWLVLDPCWPNSLELLNGLLVYSKDHGVIRIHDHSPSSKGGFHGGGSCLITNVHTPPGRRRVYFFPGGSTSSLFIDAWNSAPGCSKCFRIESNTCSMYS